MMSPPDWSTLTRFSSHSSRNCRNFCDIRSWALPIALLTFPRTENTEMEVHGRSFVLQGCTLRTLLICHLPRGHCCDVTWTVALLFHHDKVVWRCFIEAEIRCSQMQTVINLFMQSLKTTILSQLIEGRVIWTPRSQCWTVFLSSWHTSPYAEQFC